MHVTLLEPCSKFRYRVVPKLKKSNLDLEDLLAINTSKFKFDLVEKEIQWKIRYTVNKEMKEILETVIKGGLNIIEVQLLNKKNMSVLSSYNFKNLTCISAETDLDYGVKEPVIFDLKFQFKSYN